MKLDTQRIVRVSRIVADLNRATDFYCQALGFTEIARAGTDLPLGKPAEEAVLRLGAAEVALLRPKKLAPDYPTDSQSNDLWFQHLAIVVSDMDAAYAHLLRSEGWQAISTDGPCLLPPENASVRAFKFRDPDGHPLELIWFPKDQKIGALFLGIDHSAIAVSSRSRSQSFYLGLGLHTAAQSLNEGPAQSALDGLPDAHVRVTGLRPPEGLGLELLAYTPPGRRGIWQVETWVTMQVKTLFGERRRLVRDPDGHLLLLVTT